MCVCVCVCVCLCMCVFWASVCFLCMSEHVLYVLLHRCELMVACGQAFEHVNEVSLSF